MEIAHIFKRLRKDNPRWVVLVIDLLIVWTCYVLSNYIINSFKGNFDLLLMLKKSAFLTLVYSLCFLYFKTYKGIIRQSGIRDAQYIMTAVAVAGGILFAVSFVVRLVLTPGTVGAEFLRLSYGVLFIHAFLTFVTMVAARIFYRTIYERIFWNERTVSRVVIAGAGNMGTVTYNILQNDTRNKYKVVAVVDDNPSRIGKRINGFHIKDIACVNENYVQNLRVDKFIIALDDNNTERLKRISAILEPLPAKIMIMPSTAKLLQGEVAARQMRTLQITDLLGRESIKLDNLVVKASLQGKVILVTGAAGSIGSELARQIAYSDCKRIILLDQAESALYDMQQEILQIAPETSSYEVGNVRDRVFMHQVFAKYKPQVVFHAAAYKHVPLMEQNPYESIRTNVCGTKNVADLAVEFGAEKFVMVSTDKAVNPTNVMGATKRIAEIYVSALNRQSTTNFIVTRFGNVLGSNGSVIPLFEKQLKKGGPLTVTHADITRYFMTIPEACQLVQEAAVMGNGGEIFVFDMGQPVKIMDLAKRMIRLKGFRYPEDIDIQITGLRPGEKTYEELLANDENTQKTHHDKIMIAKVNTEDVALKKYKIEALCTMICSESIDRMALVTAMKDIVPEYISKNSIYEQLDNAEGALI
ncbi:polysaccharide biosynthesis protein [Sphingobacterium alkalisoli]|uniref:Polysaccharide biosynthesis protein n=1 Tax=Sphingobacterium alkalisoli TaxID=1874115 RepID=A0A4U0GN11_9SPHI|nr:nucleoside-diphosphate sugar epimerase/dehydratase [Sphingobacterium alkalisoli]TJY60123.1 polysaccharide biosynthesis protein [Sphingobacterium alkalisoli]GGH32043.1 capsular polysaccharide biosynthesis protein [Sphingobacterium alkalisoli]